MGSWQLEVGKMFIYIMFPVTAFHIFNHPAIIENVVAQFKDESLTLSPQLFEKDENFHEKLKKLSAESFRRGYKN